MTVYEKIDELYSDDEVQRPAWVDEIKAELNEIKTLLKDIKNPRRQKRKNRDYFAFVNQLRDRLQPDTMRGIYPELHYNGKRVGVNFKGLLYDKATAEQFPSSEAFAIYEYFYAKREQIDSFIKVDS